MVLTLGRHRIYIIINIISLFSDSMNVSLWSLTFVTKISFLTFFRKYRTDISPAFAMLLFNLATLAYSFNMLRQNLAMGVLIWAIYFLIKKIYIPFIIISLVTLSLHKSSILVLGIVLIIYIYSLIKEKFKESRLLFVMIIFTAVATIILRNYPDLLNSITSELNLSNVKAESLGSVARLLLFMCPVFYFRLKIKEAL